MDEIEEGFEARVDIDAGTSWLVSTQEILQYQQFENAGFSMTCKQLTVGLPVGENDVFPESAVKTTYWPFKSEEQWKLAMWALFPTPLP